MENLNELFSKETLQRIFPAERSNEFFDALFGDASEGAYDIKLSFKGHNASANILLFDLELHERPGKCLACNLTYGLPEVFSRHPIINVNGVVSEIDSLLGNATSCCDWRLGSTNSVSSSLHTIPLEVTLS
jgi:hypothetical protein